MGFPVRLRDRVDLLVKEQNFSMLSTCDVHRDERWGSFGDGCALRKVRRGLGKQLVHIGHSTEVVRDCKGFEEVWGFFGI